MEALGAAEEATQDRVTIYIPSRDRDGEAVDFEVWVARSLGLLSEVAPRECRRHKVRGETHSVAR
jgi:hypothetical protein